jgi:hypothetical protein
VFPTLTKRKQLKEGSYEENQAVAMALASGNSGNNQRGIGLIRPLVLLKYKVAQALWIRRCNSDPQT